MRCQPLRRALCDFNVTMFKFYDVNFLELVWEIVGYLVG